MKFPIFIVKEKQSDYGVTIPDLPGCFSAGKTIEDAIDSAHEAAECHLEGLLIDGQPIPEITAIENHKNELGNDGLWAIVDVDVIKISGKVKRVNVSISERLLKQADYYVKKHGGNRSALLSTALLQYLGSHR